MYDATGGWKTGLILSPTLSTRLTYSPPLGVRNRVLSKTDFFRALNGNFAPWARTSKILFISLCQSHEINIISHESKIRLAPKLSALSAKYCPRFVILDDNLMCISIHYHLSISYGHRNRIVIINI